MAFSYCVSYYSGPINRHLKHSPKPGVAVEANVMPVSQGSTGEAAVGQGAQSVPTVRPQRNDSGQSVKQEMAR